MTGGNEQRCDIHQLLEQTFEFAVLGDVHGNLGRVQEAVSIASESGIKFIIQLGDFGFWEHTNEGLRYLRGVNDVLKEHDMFLAFIDGNHENHDLLADYNPNESLEPIRIRSRIYHLPRGCFLQVGNGVNVMAVGGAFSIDRRYRTKHVSWWPQETITEADLEKACRYPVGSIDVLLCHEAPQEVWNVVISGYQIPESANQRRLISRIMQRYKPEFVFHGHYHQYHRTNVDSSVVVGLAGDGQPMSQNLTFIDVRRMNR